MASGKIAKSGSVLLWTNSDVSQTFSSQTLKVGNLDDYRLIHIEYVETTTTTAICDFILARDSTQNHYMYHVSQPSSGIPKVYSRTVRPYPSTTGITFGEGLEKACDSSSRVSNNNAVIPYRIYGIR